MSEELRVGFDKNFKLQQRNGFLELVKTFKGNKDPEASDTSITMLSVSLTNLLQKNSKSSKNVQKNCLLNMAQLMST